MLLIQRQPEGLPHNPRTQLSHRHAQGRFGLGPALGDGKSEVLRNEATYERIRQ